jgi:hypothetical protein
VKASRAAALTQASSHLPIRRDSDGRRRPRYETLCESYLVRSSRTQSRLSSRQNTEKGSEMST